MSTAGLIGPLPHVLTEIGMQAPVFGLQLFTNTAEIKTVSCSPCKQDLLLCVPS